MSQMRDLSPIAGAMIWARQIERQLLTYMKRVEDVLGKANTCEIAFLELYNLII